MAEGDTMSGKNGKGGRIITGPGNEPMQDGPEGPDAKEPEFQVPPMHQYTVVWFNPETNDIEHEAVEAHIVEPHDSGLLLFKAFSKVHNPQPGEPPFTGYYVTSFGQHIRFWQAMPKDAVN